MPHKRVFISSTREDLNEYRLVVEKTLREMNFDTISVNNWSASDKDAIEVCRTKVNQADIYVGVVAHRYGSIAPGFEKSFTELEYEWAKEKGIPCYCFFINDNAQVHPQWIEIDAVKRQRLEAFKQKLQHELVIARFATPTELALEVSKALYSLSMPLLAEQNGVQILPDYKSAYPMLLEHVKSHDVKLVRMIMYSGHLIEPTIEEIIDRKIRVQILLQHPNLSANEYYKSNTINFIKHFFDVRASENKQPTLNLEVGFYKSKAAYKGICIEDQLVISGWYTYEEAPISISGGNNPHVIVKKTHPAFNKFQEMFNKVFQTLKRDSDPLDDYLDNNPL
jgi:hypothetical protein